MALSREQHNRIMRIYQDRRLADMQERSRRQEEVALHVPAFVRLTDELTRLRSEYVKELLGRRAGETRGTLSAEIRELEAERRAVLKEAGYPEDYLELHYVCPLCRDTGYVNYQKCGCHKRLISEEIYRAEAGLPAVLSRESFETFDLSVFDDREPIPELKGKAGRAITQRAYMQTVEQVVRGYAERFSEKGGNLLFCGETGTGKTFLCNCVAEAVISQCRQVLYVKSESFFEQLARENFDRQNGSGHYGTEEAFHCDLLILDDLGTERRTDFTLSKLFSLIDSRQRAGKSTIISTNLGGNHIINVYGERIASRLAQYTVIPFYGKDLRLRRGV